MTKCEWCNSETEKLFKVSSLGTEYNVCKSCYDASEAEICIKCKGPITGHGSIKGLCYGCSQAEYEDKQRKEEELASGVALELLEAYSNGVEITEEDYNHWMTFSQGTFSPAYLKECRQNWLRKKLIEQGGWSSDLVESNLDAIESLMEKHISKVLNGKYMLVYYDPKNTKQRIRQFIDHTGHIFLVEKK